MFNPEEEKEIITAIAFAEKMTSGEICVHISQKADKNTLTKTKHIFKKLKMHNTKERNAVLIHLALGSRSFAIYGDQGIHQKVGNDFWKSTTSTMQQHFVKGEMKEGLIAGIKEIGEKLRIYFPHQLDDVNELQDQITYDE